MAPSAEQPFVPLDPDAQLGYLVVRVADRMSRSWYAALRAHGINPRQFSVLEYLLRNKNRVVSRVDLAINVWDIDFDTNTNVIDVYISYVRNKVDKQFEKKLIHTHVGMGYILKEND